MKNETFEAIFMLLNGEYDAKHLSSWLNTHSSSKFDLCDSLLSQPLEKQEVFTKLSLLWLIHLNYLGINDLFDERNRHSASAGTLIYDAIKEEINILYSPKEKSLFETRYSHRELKELFEDEKIKEFYMENDYYINFIDYFKRDHNTLQQLFSSIAMYWLVNLPASLFKSNFSYKSIASKLKNLESIKGKAIYMYPLI